MQVLLPFLAVFALFGAACAQDDCDACPHIFLEASGGLEDEYPRYIATWNKQGLYNGKAFYTCTAAECQGLRDQMIYHNGAWRIVDCLPDAVGACGGSHSAIVSSPASPTSCPYDDLMPWDYCTGDFIVGGECTEYTEDLTVRFNCVEP